MSTTDGTTARSRPERAIAARRDASTTKVAAVRKAINSLGRTGVPITRAAVATLAGVSRSFTYENPDARSLISAAQARTGSERTTRVDTQTEQQEASWRERALNAEDQARILRQEIAKQRDLVSDLLGRLRDRDGTWIERDRDRLREDNGRLLAERNQLARERSDLQRRLEGARAQVSRLNERRVAELFPSGPAPAATRVTEAWEATSSAGNVEPPTGLTCGVAED